MHVNMKLELKQDSLGFYELSLNGLRIDEFCFKHKEKIYTDQFGDEQIEVTEDITRFDENTELMLIESSVMEAFNNEDDNEEAVTIYKQLLNKIGVN